MNGLVNLLLKVMGFGKAVEALDGESSKAYIGALGLILSGAATLLTGLANVVGEVVPLQGGAEYIKFLSNLSHDANAAIVLAGVAAISKGVADIGNRHAVAKLQNSLTIPSGKTAAEAPSLLPTKTVD